MLTKILRSSLIDFTFVMSEKRLEGVDPSMVTTCKLPGSMYAKAKLILIIKINDRRVSSINGGDLLGKRI